jgi:CRISPR-associated protein Cas8c/Csd1 subtype I-C
MFIKALNDLYNELREAEDDWYYLTGEGENRHGILWKGTLAKDGTLLAITPIKTLKKKDGAEAKTTQQMLVPWMPGTPTSGSGIAPQPGFSRKTEDAFGLTKRGTEVFNAWIHLHEEIQKNSGETTSLATFLGFLKAWQEIITAESQNGKFQTFIGVEEITAQDTQGGVVFQIEGETQYVHESDWAKKAAQKKEEQVEGRKIFCPILGQEATEAGTHPKINRIGNNPLFSINKDCFESYGKEKETAGISQEAADRYGKVLNTLSSEECRANHIHRMIGSPLFHVFWTGPTGAEEEVKELLGWGITPKSEAQDQEALKGAQETFKGLSEGKTKSRNYTVHLLDLLPQTGRTAVRSYSQIRLADLEKNVRIHELDCSLNQDQPEKLQAWKIQEAVSSPSPGHEEALLRSILNNTPYPESMAALALNKLGATSRLGRKRRTEKDPTWEKETSPTLRKFLKGWITRRRRKRNDMKTFEEEPSYHLGRIMNLMEGCQRASNGGKDPNKGITERFAKRLSQTPASTLPSLIDLHRNHLKKLRRDEPGRAVWFDKKIQEQMNLLGSLPQKTGKEEQAIFWLGYYARTEKTETPEKTEE